MQELVAAGVGTLIDTGLWVEEEVGAYLRLSDFFKNWYKEFELNVHKFPILIGILTIFQLLKINRSTLDTCV